MVAVVGVAGGEVFELRRVRVSTSSKPLKSSRMSRMPRASRRLVRPSDGQGGSRPRAGDGRGGGGR